ncbi:MAG: hypothetical protein ACYDDE_04025 [bacterium]
MTVIKKNNEILIRAYINKDTYEKAKELQEEALKHKFRLSLRDIIKKGLYYKENDEDLTKVKTSCYVDSKKYKQFDKLRKNIIIQVEDLVEYGLKQSINEFKKIVNKMPD